MNSNNERVSVIVPVYKVEKDLENCIRSLCGQTYRNIEIILVDDGSPDRCGEIADRAAERDPRIRVIHKENGGLSDARNAGLETAGGDYLCFVDSDDLLEPEFVERTLQLALQHDAGMVVCGYSVFQRPAEESAPKHTEKRKSARPAGKRQAAKNGAAETAQIRIFSALEAMKAMLYQREFDVSAWGKLYRADTLDGVRFPKGMIHEDLATTYKSVALAGKVIFTPEKLYRYQIRADSIENEKYSQKKMDCIRTSRSMLEDIERNWPECADAARSRFAAAHFHILAQIPGNPPERGQIIEGIRQVRGQVLKDRHAGKRVRAACLLTYFGFGLTVRILNREKRHKYDISSRDESTGA